MLDWMAGLRAIGKTSIFLFIHNQTKNTCYKYQNPSDAFYVKATAEWLTSSAEHCSTMTAGIIDGVR